MDESRGIRQSKAGRKVKPLCVLRRQEWRRCEKASTRGLKRRNNELLSLLLLGPLRFLFPLSHIVVVVALLVVAAGVLQILDILSVLFF